jgi:hypothetical protein
VSVQSHGDYDDDDDAGWGKLLTRPPKLSGNPTSRDIWERAGGMDEGVRILPIQYLKCLKGSSTSRKFL